MLPAGLAAPPQQGPPAPPAGYAAALPPGVAGGPQQGPPSPLASCGAALPLGPAMMQQQPQQLTQGMPDPATIDQQKAAHHSNLEEQMTKAEEMLVQQQKEQTDYIYRAAEVQKKQIIGQIEQQAREQELVLSQKYTEKLTSLQQQCMMQKVLLEKQASELSNAFHMRKMQEEMMEKEFQKQKVQHDEKTKQVKEMSAQQRNQMLQHQPERWEYRADLKVPIDIRAEPNVMGQRTRSSLQPGDHFLVCQEQEGLDGILYLKLADGRGWLFDRKPDAGVMCVRHGGPPAAPAMWLPTGRAMGAPQMASLPEPWPPASGATGLPGTAFPSAPALAPVAVAPPQSGVLDRSAACPLGGAGQAAAGPGPSHWLYSPDIIALMDVRSVPDVNGPRTPHVMQPGDVFTVSEEREGSDGILYLRLADGRGWVFDRKPGAGNMCVRHPAVPPGARTGACGLGGLPAPTQMLQTGPLPPPAMSQADLGAAHASAVLRSHSFDLGSGSQQARAAALGTLRTAHPAIARAASFAVAAPRQGGSQAISHWMYSPEVMAPIATRSVPELDGQRLVHRLQPGEVFAVSEERESDGIVFLRLADGRGWLFDRKPGVGAMCVRHPRPAQAPPSTVVGSTQTVPMVLVPGAGAAAQPVMVATQQMAGYHVLAPAATSGCASPPMGSTVHPAMVPTTTVSPAPLQTGDLPGGMQPAVRGASVVLPVTQPAARGASVVLPSTQYVGPAAGSAMRSVSMVIPPADYAGSASASPRLTSLPGGP